MSIKGVPRQQAYTLRRLHNCVAVQPAEVKFGRRLVLAHVQSSRRRLQEGMNLWLRAQGRGQLNVVGEGERIALRARLRPFSLADDGWTHCWTGPFEIAGETPGPAGDLFLYPRLLGADGRLLVARIELFDHKSTHVRPSRTCVQREHLGEAPAKRSPYPPHAAMPCSQPSAELEAWLDLDQDDEGEAYDDLAP